MLTAENVPRETVAAPAVSRPQHTGPPALVSAQAWSAPVSTSVNEPWGGLVEPLSLPNPQHDKPPAAVTAHAK